MYDLNKDGVVESTDLHQQDILLMNIGDSKFYPIGVGVHSWINTNTVDEDLKRKITNEFTKDNIKIRELKVVDKELLIDAVYEG